MLDNTRLLCMAGRSEEEEEEALAVFMCLISMHCFIIKCLSLMSDVLCVCVVCLGFFPPSISSGGETKAICVTNPVQLCKLTSCLYCSSKSSKQHFYLLTLGLCYFQPGDENLDKTE